MKDVFYGVIVVLILTVILNGGMTVTVNETKYTVKVYIP